MYYALFFISIFNSSYPSSLWLTLLHNVAELLALPTPPKHSATTQYLEYRETLLQWCTLIADYAEFRHHIISIWFVTLGKNLMNSDLQIPEFQLHNTSLKCRGLEDTFYHRMNVWIPWMSHSRIETKKKPNIIRQKPSRPTFPR